MENTQTQRGDENQGRKKSLNLVSTPNTGDTGGAGTAAATARSFYDQAKETAGQAYEAVSGKAADKLDQQRSTLSDGLTAVADSVRQVSSNLGSSQTDSGLAEAAARYTDTAARKIENVAGYFENKDVRGMARDLESFARRNPAIFIGAAFGIGVVIARFLKSTPPSTRSLPSGTGSLESGSDFGSPKRSNPTSYSSKPGDAGDELNRDEPADFGARPL